MTLLIAGASGFLGKSIVHFASQSNKVFTLIRSTQAGIYKLQRDNQVLAKGAISDVTPIVRNLGISSLINVSGEVTKERSFDSIPKLIEANIEFPTLLAELAVMAGIPRIVHASTFSHTTNGVSYSPQTLYASTKRAIEDIFLYYTQQLEIQILCLEVYDLYGPNQSHGRIFDLLYKCLVTGEKLELHGNGYQEVSPLFVDDAARAFISATSVPLPNKSYFQNFSVPGSTSITIRELADVMSKSLNVKFHPGQLQFGFEPPAPTVQNVKLAHGILPGFTHHTSLELGIKKTYGLHLG